MEKNKEKNYDFTAFDNYSVTSNRQRRAYLNIAKRCNAKCVYCDDWKTDRSPKIETPPEILMIVIDNLKVIGIDHVTISGGEPLIRTDIWSILKYINKVGLTWSIITNGSMLTKANSQRLIDANPTHVNISVDSLNPDHLRKIRGLDINKILDNLFYFQELVNKTGKAVPISIIAVISRRTIPDIITLVEFCNTHKIGLTLQPIHIQVADYGSDIFVEHWPMSSDIRKLEAIIETLISGKNKKNWRIENTEGFLKSIPQFFRNRTFHPITPCESGAFDIVIDTDLNVLPCWAMKPISQISTDKSLESIISSSLYQNIHKEIKSGNCPGCLYSCHLNRQLA